VNTLAAFASACADEAPAADTAMPREDVAAVPEASPTAPDASESPADIGLEEVADDLAPTDVAPADVTPADVTPTDVAPSDVTPTDVAPTDVAPTDVTPTDVPSTDVAPTDVPPVEELPRFSFFVTSYEAMQRLSGSVDGFGGDLRFGEASGLAGADRICTTIAEEEMPGAGRKGWRAFLSATDDGAGQVVHAIERIGEGPWYDRHQRLVASDRSGLAAIRPAAEAAIANDLPNERGESLKSQPGPGADGTADNHDVLTGSDAQGRLDNPSPSTTCLDWTSVGEGHPRVGHSWPAQSGQSWVATHPATGCAAVVNLLQNGPGDRDCAGVGCGGGYGAIYCFALIP
jgi:hypothetical protein